MAREKRGETIAAEMVEDAGRDIDLAAEIGRKGVAVKEAAGEGFNRGKASRFSDEGGVEVNAREFDSFLRQGSSGGEPANGVTDAAADVDDSDGITAASGTHSSDCGVKQLQDAMAMVELFSEALHFPMDSEHEAINGEGIKDAVAIQDSVDDAKSFAIPGCLESFADSLFGDGHAL